MNGNTRDDDRLPVSGAGFSCLERIGIRLRACSSFFLGCNCSRPQCRRLVACDPDDLWKAVFRGSTWTACPAVFFVGSPEYASQRVGCSLLLGVNLMVFGADCEGSGGDGSGLPARDGTGAATPYPQEPIRSWRNPRSASLSSMGETQKLLPLSRTRGPSSGETAGDRSGYCLFS